jgi:hypothetical protein
MARKLLPRRAGRRIIPCGRQGLAYAHKHLVVPGNEDYLQSYAQYLAAEED